MRTAGRYSVTSAPAVAYWTRPRCHRGLRVHGKVDKVALVPRPREVGRARDRAMDDRVYELMLRGRTGTGMDRLCATCRLRALTRGAGISIRRSVACCDQVAEVAAAPGRLARSRACR